MKFARGSVLLVATALLVPWMAAPASAGGAHYGRWSFDGGSGTMSIPLGGFPDASVETTSTSAAVQTGRSAFLNASTPVGARYGSSQNQPYVNLRTARGGTPSTTTLTFDTPPAAGKWAFTLGDIDADAITISAVGADGSPLTAAQLGWQGAFNYCNGSPLPSTCSPGPHTDVPSWDPAAMELMGNVGDTSGASGWFQPTVAVKSLSLKFRVLSGIPIYQLWTSALAVEIHGKLTSDCGVPVGASLALVDENGAPVEGPNGRPMMTTARADGGYTFTDLEPGTYKVVVTEAGYKPASAMASPTTEQDADNVDMALTCVPIIMPSAPPIHVIEGEPTVIPLPPGLHDAKIVEPPHYGTVRVEEDKLIYTAGDTCDVDDEFTYSALNVRGQTVSQEIKVHIDCPLPETGGGSAVPLLGFAGLALLAGSVVLFGSRRSQRLPS